MTDSARARIVDVHTHVVPPLPDHARRLGDDRWPSFTVTGQGADAVGQLRREGAVVRTVGRPAWDMQARVAAMDELGVDHHVLSPLPPLVCDWGDAREGTAWSRALNESIAGLVATHPDRFSGFGTLTMHHPESAVAELEHAHSLGLSGVEIGTAAGALEFDAPQLDPVFAAAAEFGLRLFIHPLIIGDRTRWTDRIRGQEVTFGLGMGTDTAIAAARLAFGGVMERYPGLSVCLAHGGGTFFWALSRIARLWDRPERDEPTRVAALTAGFLVDTVVYEPRNIAYLADAVGPSRMLFGSDYPLPAQDDLRGAVLADRPATERAAVLGANADRWLGLSPAGRP